MRQVNVHDAKTQLSRILEEVEAGDRVIIARAGMPVAIVSSYRAATRRRKLGLFAGQAKVSEDFDELPPDMEEAFEGGTG